MKPTEVTYIVLDGTTPLVVNVNNEFTTNRPYESFTDLTAFTARLDELDIAYDAANFTVPAVEPDWQGFLSPFYSPAFGNSPFDIVETAVQTAWLHATDDPAKHGAMSLRTHWNNCIIGLTNPVVRSKEWLTSSWNFLLSLLTQNGVALTEEQRQGIEALFKQYYLM